jgi:hypothetical protein
MTLAAVLAVAHGSHEDTGTALSSISYNSRRNEYRAAHSWSGAFTAQTLDFPITIDLVVLEHSQLGPGEFVSSWRCKKIR